ncbi:MAG: ComF family protein [Candidatus Komeilibacteria bacterium]|nr:ComF family protein [Candidatus Komeilibacteria bacterium]
MKILQIILEVIFPTLCIGCRAEGQILCTTCRQTIPARYNLQCPICNRSQTDDSICALCQPQVWLDKIIIAAPYENPLLQTMIQAFKYGHVHSLATPLADLLIQNLPTDKESYLVIPTPLHRRRFQERGFNQSELLAKILALNFAHHLRTDCIRRIKNTAHQADLKREERLINMRNAFRITHPEAVAGQNILLVDDVITTAATLNEQARVLKEAGAASITAIVLAKNS